MTIFAPASILRRFRRDEGGSVAMMFGLAVIPLCLIGGAALDYARGAREKVVLNNALDATALAMAQDARRFSERELTARAQTYFDAVHAAQGGLGAPRVTLRLDAAAQRLSIATEQAVPTTLMKLGGVETMRIAAASTVSYGSPNIEIALVLDNTGSMGWAGKMPALQAAARKFVDDLAAKARAKGEIKVSIVPFATQVRVDPSRAGQPWLSAPPWDWTGCVADRDAPFDVSTVGAEQHPAVNCAASTLSPVIGLTDVSVAGATASLKGAIDAMTPGGATNLTIGLVWGKRTLTPGSPFPGADAFRTSTRKFIVALTDGTNTQNRWYGNGGAESPEVNARNAIACANLKSPAEPVTVYTIRVIEGNVALLRACASSPDKYFEAADAAGIQPAFQAILNSILSIRLAS